VISIASPALPNGAHPLGRASEILRGYDREAAKTPNDARYALPHVMTFAGIANSISRTYSVSDEVLRHAPQRAAWMRNDPSVMECLESRQRATALLKWHLETDEPKNPRHKAVIDGLTKLIKLIPDFVEYRRNMLEALWYGRHANAHKWGRKVIDGKTRHFVEKWRPVHGDKLVFRYALANDDGWADDQIGVRVSPQHVTSGPRDTKHYRGRHVEPAGRTAYTDQGMAYFVEPHERCLLAMHKHIIEDGPFEDMLSSGRIHGVGIRDRIYWCWYQKQEAMATIMELIERFGTGFTIYRYPAGNDKGREEIEKIAREHRDKNQIIMPALPGDPAMDAYSIERIEPNNAGVDALKGIIHEFFGHQIKRYIIGQTLTSEASGTGLGSNLADVQLGTFMQIIQYDAAKLAESETRELVEPLKRFNFPDCDDIDVRMVIEAEGDEAAKKIEGYKTGWEMGLKIPESAVREVLNVPEALPGEAVLSKQAMEPPALPGVGLGAPSKPGMPPGAPGGDDEQDGDGQPAMPPPKPGEPEGGQSSPEADPSDMGDPGERAASIAELVSHVYGPQADAVLASMLGDDAAPPRTRYASGAGSSKWNPDHHPRGPGGRFIPKGSSEAAQTAKDKIREIVQGGRNANTANDLLSHLNLLTSKQLHELKKSYGVSASGRVKADLVQKLAERLGDGKHQKALRDDQTPVAPLVQDVHTVPTSSLQVDPSRFQYKVSGIGEGGVGQELKGTSKWNPELGGTLLVWRDPANGKDYVINGHHRFELANRAGQGSLNVRYIDASTAKEARANGALANIAEGRGTPIDAAKYLRDSEKSIDHLQQAGVSLSGRVAQDATTLLNLGEKPFQALTEGRLDEAKAIAVSKHLKDHSLQDLLFNKLAKREDDGKEWSNREIEQAAKKMASAGKVTQAKQDLFGAFDDEQSTFDQEVELESHVSRILSQEAGNFGAVASDRRAAAVADAGNVLNVEENKKRAEQARNMADLFDQQSGLKGGVSDTIKRHAAALATAKTKKEKEHVKQRVIDDIRIALAGFGGASQDRGAAKETQPLEADRRGSGTGGAEFPPPPGTGKVKHSRYAAPAFVRRYAFDPAQPRNEDGEWEDKEGAWRSLSDEPKEKLENDAAERFEQWVDQSRTTNGIDNRMANLAFQKALHVFGSMSPVALGRWLHNVSRVEVYPDRESLTRAAERIAPEFARQRKNDPTLKATGFWNRRTRFVPDGVLHLNGGLETDQSYSEAIADIYSHEFAHAIDGVMGHGGKFVRASETELFAKAARDEYHLLNAKRQVDDNRTDLRTSSREVFSDFARYLWTQPNWTLKNLPLMTQAWTRMKWHG
jgi:hypothetical protein